MDARGKCAEKLLVLRKGARKQDQARSADYASHEVARWCLASANACIMRADHRSARWDVGSSKLRKRGWWADSLVIAG